MIIERIARPTLTAVELDHGDELHFVLAGGQTRRIRVLKSGAEVEQSNLATLPKPGPLAKVVLRMYLCLSIDGHEFSIARRVGSPESFYSPWEFFGLRLWFDACTGLFDHLKEDHGSCKPRKHVRLAVQDASQRICPVLLHPWCPLHEGGLRIEECYQGSDCWMGPYFGVDAHGGLDINHPAGTPIWTPIALDDHRYFNSIAAGDNNNRWRGTRRWADGSTWVLQVHHLLRLRVKEGGPLDAGVLLADAAGVHIGSHEHSHFVFGVIEPGAAESDKILLDPWILFWQMYQDRQSVMRR